jgi:gliding motility associated protien GldN
MKIKTFIGILFIALLYSGVASAQRKKTNRNTSSGSGSAYGSGGSSYGSGTSSGSDGGSSYGSGTSTNTGGSNGSSSYGNNNQPQPSNQPASNIPIRVAKAKSIGGSDTILPSKRPEAIERNLVKERKPLPFEHIREDDAVYRQRVWREIDTREKMNAAFRNAWNEDNGNQRFIYILLNAIKQGKIMAFDPVDDRFTTLMTPQKVSEAFAGGIDTVPVYDLQGNIEAYEVREKEFNPDSVYKYRIKEEWVFDKETSRMFVRILGICPVKAQYIEAMQKSIDIPLFWVYYPTELRPLLADFEAYNPKNFGAKMTWEELFENRMFSSYVTKTTMDNPYDRKIRDYIKDPILALLEGDRIMEKIFNYEQDLWSY